MRIWDVLSQKKVPEKHFIFNDGFCHVHKSIHAEDVKKAKELHPEAVVLAHPECTGDVLKLADFVGSTSQIIDYATNSDEKVFLICTEMGVFYELLQKNPEKKFFLRRSPSVLPEYEEDSSGQRAAGAGKSGGESGDG